MGRNYRQQYCNKQDAFISVQVSMSDHRLPINNRHKNRQYNHILFIPHIASDVNMTIVNLIEMPVLMLLFYNNTKEIAIVQFKFLVFLYKIYYDKDRHIILLQR